MKLLEVLQRDYRRAFELWPQFEERAARDGYSADDALERLIRRYLVHGFDDGQPEPKVAR
jgi:hypothetical protein